MLSPIARRLLLTGLPTLLVAAVVASTLWGEAGLIARHELRQELVEANTQLAETERDNQRLLREIRLMERDRAVTERIVADELGWASDGAVLYRFEEQ